MSELKAEIAAEVVGACAAGAEAAGQALSAAFDQSIALAPGEAAIFDASELPDDWNGPGLIVTLRVGQSSAIAVLAEASGLIPEWVASPDSEQAEKLASLATELGKRLLPEAFAPQECRSARAENLAAAVSEANVAPGAAMLPLALSSDDKQATMALVWPVGALRESATSESPASQSSAARPAPARPTRPRTFDDGVDLLPPYTRSLLRIQVPVHVTLAETKQNIADVLAIGPGSIIQFEKLCDEMLDLEVGGHRIAQGEAVKAGDRFGLRIAAIVLPDERFKQVRPPRGKPVEPKAAE